MLALAAAQGDAALRSLLLAVAAIMAAASRDDDPLDRPFTDEARFALPTVHPMLQLEKSFFAVGVNVVTDRRATKRDSFA